LTAHTIPFVIDLYIGTAICEGVDEKGSEKETCWITISINFSTRHPGWEFVSAPSTERQASPFKSSTGVITQSNGTQSSKEEIVIQWHNPPSNSIITSNI
jgi:hypothetical protein